MGVNWQSCSQQLGKGRAAWDGDQRGSRAQEPASEEGGPARVMRLLGLELDICLASKAPWESFSDGDGSILAFALEMALWAQRHDGHMQSNSLTEPGSSHLR